MHSFRLSRHCTLILASLLLVSTLCWPAPPQNTIARLQARVERLAHSFPGTIGVYARNIETGAEVAVNVDQLFPMASVYKVAIMVHVFREVDAGRLSLTERIVIRETDRRLGSGLLSYMTPGLNPTLYDLLLLMITISDNQATDMLLERVGAANVTATLRQLGLKDIRVDRSTAELIGDLLTLTDQSFRGKSPAYLLAHPELYAKITPEKREQAYRAFLEDKRDVSSPRAMVELLVEIFRAEAASQASCKEMLQILRRQQFGQRISRYLEGIGVGNKTGTVGYTVNDAGIIYAGKQHIALAVFTLKANSQVSTEEAQQRIGEIARTIYDYFHYVGLAVD